jgi:hypothetical protein
MDTSERRLRPENTQELLAMWSAAKEQHFVQELVQLLPSLVGRTGLSENQVEDAARHLVRALHLAARPEGGIHAAMDYLTKMVEGKTAAASE